MRDLQIKQMEELSAAESRMSSIESRLLAIESVGESVSDNSNVQDALNEYQKQVLVKLKAIRNQIEEEGGDVSKIKEERDQSVAENIRLKKEIEKLNYRVQHLVKALNEEETKNLTSL